MFLGPAATLANPTMCSEPTRSVEPRGLLELALVRFGDWLDYLPAKETEPQPRRTGVEPVGTGGTRLNRCGTA